MIHSVIISHNNAIRQDVNSHFKTIVSKYEHSKMPAMQVNSEKIKIANKHRAAFRYWIKERDLTVDGWCKAAGISEGTLRNFLNAHHGNTLQASTLELLAKALNINVGTLLREDIPKIYAPSDNRLLQVCGIYIMAAAKSKGIKLEMKEVFDFTISYYDFIIERRSRGEIIEPNETMADLILKTNTIS